MLEPALFPVGYSDHNVMQSKDVNKMVLCFLVAGGTFNSCPPSGGAVIGQAQAPYQMDNSAARGAAQPRLLAQATSGTKPNKKLTEANDRVDVLLDHPLTLAEPAHIPLRIRTAGLATILVSQRQYEKYGNHFPDDPEGGEQRVPVEMAPDGSPYITITPLRLGKVELRLVGIFPDAGMLHKTVTLDVVPTQQRPESMTVGSLGYPDQNTPRVLMSMTGEQAQNAFNIALTYKNVSVPIRVDPSYVNFRVITDGVSDPIRLNQETGHFTAIHPGQALVQISFGGRTNLTCIAVEPTLASVHSYPLDRCQKLIPAGKKLGPVE